MSNQAHRAATKRLLREKEICEMLDVSRVSLWNWRRRNLFPAPIRIGRGRSIRWRVEDVETWLVSRPVA